MVQGLAFLSKKSWHTKTLANQERVWMAEQRKAAEESKTKELAKQIEQEREQEELDRIAGRKSVRRDRGIDWMYQGGTAEAAREAQEQKNEEYLLGKEYVPEKGATGDFADLEQGGVNSIVAASANSATAVQQEEEEEKKPAAAVAPVPAANAEPSVAERNEAFRMRHEDPMFLVSQTQREKQTRQDKKRALYERVVGPTTDKRPVDATTADDRRRSRRERKRDRKHHHRRHRSRSRSRSPSRDRDHYKRRHGKRHRSRSPSEDRRRRSSPEHRHYDERRHGSRRRHDRSRSRSHDRHERRRYRSRSPSPREYRRWDRANDTHDERQRYEREANVNERKPYQPPNRDQQDRSSRPEGYGLQGKSPAGRRRHNDLGPNRQLLDQKRQERDSERRHKRETASTRRPMTDEERAAAIQAMQHDASKRDELLNQAVAAKRRDHQEEDHDAAPSGANASFLQDMAERTHGIRNHGGNSLASRVTQNRHTNQKLSDDFL